MVRIRNILYTFVNNSETNMYPYKRQFIHADIKLYLRNKIKS